VNVYRVNGSPTVQYEGSIWKHDGKGGTVSGTLEKKNFNSQKEAEDWVKKSGVQDAPVYTGTRVSGVHHMEKVAEDASVAQNKNGEIKFKPYDNSFGKVFHSVADFEHTANNIYFNWPEVKDKYLSKLDPKLIDYEGMEWRDLKRYALQSKLYKVGMSKEDLIRELNSAKEPTNHEIYKQAVKGIKAANEKLAQRQPGTVNHENRVAASVSILAHRLKLDKDHLVRAFLAAKGHDVGKTGMHKIINKDTRLTDAEFATVKKHPELTEKILTIKKYGVAADIAHMGSEHHEQAAPGKGYPAHEGTPSFGAQILQVADIADSLIGGSDSGHTKKNIYWHEETEESKVQKDGIISSLLNGNAEDISVKDAVAAVRNAGLSALADDKITKSVEKSAKDGIISHKSLSRILRDILDLQEGPRTRSNIISAMNEMRDSGEINADIYSVYKQMLISNNIPAAQRAQLELTQKEKDGKAIAEIKTPIDEAAHKAATSPLEGALVSH